MAGSPLAPTLHLKSGSMTGVQCYAGYYTGKRSSAVVVMVNHFSGTRASVQKEIADMLTRVLTTLDNRK